MDRREFLRASAASGVALSGAVQGLCAAPNDRVTVCVMGVRGRGGNLLQAFASLSDVDVKYVCDIDESVLEARVAQTAKQTGRKPRAIKDYRTALDDPAVDALVSGCPDHWHALPSIHACQAGKDVYVEKPDGHNLLEGRTMVAAAQKYERIVQLGTQARSGVHHQRAVDYIRAGNLGKVRFAKAWESSRQGAVGPAPDSAPPAGVDYDLWLGPAPRRPFNRYRFHGNWRWFFDYGSGDLGNDGVHRLDFTKWMLDAAIEAAGEKPIGMPRSVSAHGGKYYFNDMQEWPDTMMVTYDYPGYVMTYEMRVWNRYQMHGESEGGAVHGDGGYVVLGNRRWRAYDERGRLAKEEAATGDYTVGHARNFVDCMRSRSRPTADLETVGHPSSMLCHLGNVAWRVGRTVQFDAQSYDFPGDDEANQFRTRDTYRTPWVLPAIAQL